MEMRVICDCGEDFGLAATSTSTGTARPRDPGREARCTTGPGPRDTGRDTGRDACWGL